MPINVSDKWVEHNKRIQTKVYTQCKKTVYVKRGGY